MKNNMKVILMYVVFILAITWLVSSFFPTKETETLTYSDVVSYFEKGEVKAKNGVIWSAKNADEQDESDIPEGSVCKIVKVDGNTLSVKIKD